MRRLISCLVLCTCALAGEEGGPTVQALPKGWRFQDLGPCRAANGRLPCAIAEKRGRVVVAFPEAEAGKLCLCTNLYRPSRWFRDEPESEEEYWDTTTLGETRLAHLDMTVARMVVLIWVPSEEKYDPRWTESVGGPGRWQTFTGDPEAPPMPAFPAFALARAGERSVYAVHNDPKARRLDYFGHPSDVPCPPAIPVADKEEVVALAVEARGTIHAFTFLDKNLFYVTNKGGEPNRELLETGELTDIRGALVADAEGAARAVYRDARTAGLLYRTNVSGKWISTVLEAGTDVGMGCAIAVDAHGKEHVCYTAGTGVRYATNSAGSWEVFSVASGAPSPGCDIAIDEQGYAHMCYAIDGRMAYATNRPAEKGK